jgi:tRNA G26 N,N-dimethylase Trm1
MRQNPTRPSDELFDPDTWDEMLPEHAQEPADAMYAKVREANKYETRVGIWKARLVRRFQRTGANLKHPRDRATLDKFVGEDPLWKALIADQQFANREAQMYAAVALVEEQKRTNQLLSEIRDELRTQAAIIMSKSS